MRLPVHRFETRVARRVLILFLVCAMLPVASFAALGYVQVRANLGEQTWERLSAAAKTLGMSLTERLLLLQSELEGARGPSDARSGGLFAEITGPDVAGSRADAEALVEGGRRGGGGGPTLLVSEEAGVGTRIWFVENEPARGRRALVRSAYLAATQQGLPPGAAACVLARSTSGALSEVFGCAHAEPAAFAGLGSDANAARIAWDHGDGPRLGVAREMFLAAEFDAPSWFVIVSEPEERVMAPVGSFSRTFILVLLLCVLGVALASNFQIHRVLDPIARLRAGTERVARGDLSTRVELSTGDEFEELSTSFNTMVGRLHRQVRALETTQRIDTSILSTHETSDIVRTVLEQAPEVVACERRWLVLLDREGGSRFEFAGDGFRRVEGRIDPAELEAMVSGEGSQGSQGESRLTVPLRIEGRLRGVLCFERGTSAFDESDRAYAARLADHVAVAISNAELFDELGDMHVGTLRALASAIDAKSRWTAGHSSRVTRLSLALGRHLGLEAEELAMLERGAILHDIGKIGVPATILDKGEQLTDDEWEVLREHPAYGMKIVGHIRQYRPILPIIGQHHERWNGSGYPNGLVGTEIQGLARLVAVADTFDAMTSERPYRSGLKAGQVLRMIEAERGVLFDPSMVDALLAVGEHLPLEERRPAPDSLAASA